MKRAIISDIHANLEALTAVAEDIQKQQVDEIICLGDVVGYGANPLECLDYVMDKCKLCILGNHDMGALYDPEGFNGSAEKAIFWTRRQLEKPSERRDERWEFLNLNPRVFCDDAWKVMYVHGSPKNPLNEYVFPEDIYNPKRIESLFDHVVHISFQGHTHVPGIFTQDCKFLTPDDIQSSLELVPQKKYLINVGSVGQPRDGNPRACYVTVEEKADGVLLLNYHRVEYPNELTAKKIADTLELDTCLGDRLKIGR